MFLSPIYIIQRWEGSNLFQLFSFTSKHRREYFENRRHLSTIVICASEDRSGAVLFQFNRHCIDKRKKTIDIAFSSSSSSLKVTRTSPAKRRWPDEVASRARVGWRLNRTRLSNDRYLFSIVPETIGAIIVCQEIDGRCGKTRLIIETPAENMTIGIAGQKRSERTKESISERRWMRKRVYESKSK